MERKGIARKREGADREKKEGTGRPYDLLQLTKKQDAFCVKRSKAILLSVERSNV